MTPTSWNVTVVGGCYVDEMLFTNGPIRRDVSLQIVYRNEAAGGPGYCYAQAMARVGASVTLVTALGDCAWSSTIERNLHREGVQVIANRLAGGVDRATIILDSEGAKLSLNSYRVSGSTRIGSSDALSPHILLVASPTPLHSVVTALRRSQQTVMLALHTRQCLELTALPVDDQRLLAQRASVACFSAADYSSHIAETFTDAPVVIVTDGRHGARVRGDGTWVEIPAVAVAADSTPMTNGAGEAFLAAYLAVANAGFDSAMAGAAAARYASAYIANGVAGDFPRRSTSELVDGTASLSDDRRRAQ